MNGYRGGRARNSRHIDLSRPIDCGSPEIGALAVQARRAGFRPVEIRQGVLSVAGRTVTCSDDLERLTVAREAAAR